MNVEDKAPAGVECLRGLFSDVSKPKTLRARVSVLHLSAEGGIDFFYHFSPYRLV